MSSWILPHFYWGIWKEYSNKIFRDKEAPQVIIAKKTKGLMTENYAITKEGEINVGGNSKSRKEDRIKRR